MANSWYSVTETYVLGLSPTVLMEWAKIFGLDLDDDLDEIRTKVSNEMSRKARDERK